MSLSSAFFNYSMAYIKRQHCFLKVYSKRQTSLDDE